MVEVCGTALGQCFAAGLDGGFCIGARHHDVACVEGAAHVDAVVGRFDGTGAALHVEGDGQVVEVRRMDNNTEVTPLDQAWAASKGVGHDKFAALEAENDAINRSQAVIYFEPYGTIILSLIHI